MIPLLDNRPTRGRMSDGETIAIERMFDDRRFFLFLCTSFW